ncbi:Uncharacterized protein APZ42_027677 [Daphnia magna]|uniref:Peptidase A2 domain-containing protein n=1 Tax=Daphnia magna TaxID=35525 RepID=A0A164R7H7_9CRUS|nr:Uncharacterized protein APZ42_027677 [Daphnia magna]
MISPSSMEVVAPTSLNPDSGAIALIEKGVQLRENYPEGGSDDDISTNSVNPSARSVPYNRKTHPKPVTARQITDSNPDTYKSYILIRSRSESADQLMKNVKKIANLKHQIQNHQTEIQKATSALALVQTQNLQLQQAHFDATISSITQQANNDRLIGEAQSQIASIQTDNNYLESRAYQLLQINSQLEQLLPEKTLELETSKEEQLALKADFRKQIDHANKTLVSLQEQALKDNADISDLKTQLRNRTATQTELEAKVKSLSEDLLQHATQYSKQTIDINTQLRSLQTQLLENSNEKTDIQQTLSNKIALLENEKTSLQITFNCLKDLPQDTATNESPSLRQIAIDLQTSNNRLIGEQAALQETISQLNDQINHLELHLKNATSSNSSKDIEINSLKQSLSFAVSKFSNQSLELNQIKDTSERQRFIIETLKTSPASNLISNAIDRCNAEHLTHATRMLSQDQPTPIMATASDQGELVSIPLREKIPHFSGYLGDISVQDWFHEAERIAKGANWSREQMKRYFSERFTKLALSFQEEIDDPNYPDPVVSYQEWKELIIQEFKDPTENQYFKNELNEIKQKTNERVRDFRARIEKILIKGYGENMFRSQNETLTSVRDDILKSVFENGLKNDLQAGYDNRISATATYDIAIATGTEVESILTRKHSSARPRQSDLSAINLSHGLLSSDIEDLKRKFEGLTCSSMETLQDKRTKPKEKPIVFALSSSESISTGLSLNAKAVRFSPNVGGEGILGRRSPSGRDFSTSPSRSTVRPTSPYNRHRSRSPYDMSRSPSPHTNRHSSSPYNHTRSLSPFPNTRSSTPYPGTRSPSPFNRSRSPNPFANQPYVNPPTNLTKPAYRNHPYTKNNLYAKIHNNTTLINLLITDNLIIRTKTFTLEHLEMSSIILPKRVPSKLEQPTIWGVVLDSSHNFNAIKLHKTIGNVSTPALVDTGAEVSVLSHIIFASLNPLYVQQIPYDMDDLKAESNASLKIVGYFRILINLPDIKSRVEHNFYIVSNLRSNCILGLDCIRDNGIIIDGNILQILSRKPKTVLAKTTFADATISVINKGPVIDKSYPFTFNLSHLSEHHEASFMAIFKNHHHYFAESMLQLGKTSLAIHQIHLIDPKPVWTHHYPIPKNLYLIPTSMI